MGVGKVKAISQIGNMVEFQRKRTGPINVLISDEPIPLINPKLRKLNLLPGQGKNN